jgi:hypothetical protein
MEKNTNLCLPRHSFSDGWRTLRLERRPAGAGQAGGDIEAINSQSKA